MRPVTRRVVLALLVVVGLLLALGAAPSYLKSGDPYYVTATPAEGDHRAIDGSVLSASRYPYVTAAIERGRSEPYWRGPFGLKGAFAHSPFDEFGALGRYEGTANETVAYVERNGTVYRVELVQPDGGGGGA